MKLILSLDKKNYQNCEYTTKKITVRAIIFIKDKLLLTQSTRYKEAKFPGGKKDGDSLKEALIRETFEETGYRIIKSSIKPWGKVIETRKSISNPKEKFVDVSYCYFARVFHRHELPHLTESEEKMGYQVKLLSIDEFIKINEKAMDLYNQIPWVERELEMLKLLKNMKNGATI